MLKFFKKSIKVPPLIPPAIYDCFIFFNELDLLEIRLDELYDKVDFFVLVEACETFRGQPKPFYFEENKTRYAKYLNKIIHVKISTPFQTTNPWDREARQRNGVIEGLVNAKDSDIVLLSDVDEIPSREKIKNIVLYVEKKPRAVVCLIQNMYLYFLNLRMQNGSKMFRMYGQNFMQTKHRKDKDMLWIGTLACNAATFKKQTPFNQRKYALKSKVQKWWSKSPYHYLYQAGWHFTTLGDAANVKNKYNAWSHAEYDNESFTSDESILFHIKEAKVEQVEEYFPHYIKTHKAVLKEKGLLL